MYNGKGVGGGEKFSDGEVKAVRKGVPEDQKVGDRGGGGVALETVMDRRITASSIREVVGS